MRLAFIFAMATLGAALVVAGVAFIFWPAAMILAGIYILGWAMVIDDGRDREQLQERSPQQVDIVDETAEPDAMVARIYG